MRSPRSGRHILSLGHKPVESIFSNKRKPPQGGATRRGGDFRTFWYRPLRGLSRVWVLFIPRAYARGYYVVIPCGDLLLANLMNS
jgi:hypothetical protein